MKFSTNRILTSHVGSLPRPDSVLRSIYSKETGQPYDREALARGMRQAVSDIVRRQTEIGIDIVNDGEQTKPNFIAYVRTRLAGFEIIEPSKRVPKAKRDALAFPGLYEERAWESATRRARYLYRARRPPRTHCLSQGGSEDFTGGGGLHDRHLAVQSRA
jgi:5-methyltetrahydropteroyltriglutamate--homocysteine methyltransferase